MNARSVLCLFVALAAGCAIHPEGESEERDRAAAALSAMDQATDPAALPADPSLSDYLGAAFHADAGLRSRYWEWRAAIERIPQVASPPNPALSFDWLFSDEHMKAWDRTTLGLSNDPMTNIQLPSKLEVAGQQALEEARAAGERFEAAKFKLQSDVIALYVDLALHAEMMRTQQDTVELLSLAAQQTSSRLVTGGGSDEVLRAQDELAVARNELETLHAQIPILVARMNALLGRDPGAAVPLPRSMPEPRPLPARDDELLALAAERSPELAALARQVAGREDALELARQARIPDFGLDLSITGNESRMFGGMLTLPLRDEAIEAGIEQALAELEAARAAQQQYSRDLAASVILDLTVLRSTERQAALFRESLVPHAELLARTSSASFAAGRVGLADLIMAQRSLLGARLTLLELTAEREKALAALETWSLLDVETLVHPRPASSASMAP